MASSQSTERRIKQLERHVGKLNEQQYRMAPELTRLQRMVKKLSLGPRQLRQLIEEKDKDRSRRAEKAKWHADWERVTDLAIKAAAEKLCPEGYELLDYDGHSYDAEHAQNRFSEYEILIVPGFDSLWKNKSGSCNVCPADIPLKRTSYRSVIFGKRLPSYKGNRCPHCKGTGYTKEMPIKLNGAATRFNQEGAIQS